MGRSPCCSKEGLNRGAWTAVEDKILRDYIKIHGEGKWRNLPKKAGLKRCGKSCRLRWLNYLRPDIKRGNITQDEEELIIRLHKLLGNRWSLIAGRLPGRTDNEIKNYWNTKIGKKLQNQQNQQIPSSSHAPILNQPQDKPNPRIQISIAQPPTVNANASLVRTKALRCSKVVIPSELQNNDQQLNGTKPVVSPASIVPGSIDDKSLPESLPQFNSEENDSSDLMMDFEMDEQLLSDILDIDLSQVTNFDNGVASDTNTCDQGHLSPNSDHSLLFWDDKLCDSNFSSMASLIELEFDWLRD